MIVSIFLATGTDSQVKTASATSTFIDCIKRASAHILSQASAALVTSGTAALEAALFRVPQVVCYFIRLRQLASLLRRMFLKVPYISLVNLVVSREVVPELVAEQMNVQNCRRHLESILPGGSAREAQLQGYEEMAAQLGEPGAPQRTAQLIVKLLQKDKS